MLVHRQVTPSKHPVIYLGEERHCDCNWSINLIGLISMLKIYTRMVKSKVEMKKKTNGIAQTGKVSHAKCSPKSNKKSDENITQ